MVHVQNKKTGMDFHFIMVPLRGRSKNKGFKYGAAEPGQLLEVNTQNRTAARQARAYSPQWLRPPTTQPSKLSGA